MVDFGFWVDESFKKNFLVLGGFYTPLSNTQSVITHWRSLKRMIGLSDSDELKWNFDQDHPSRLKMQRLGGYSLWSFREKIVECILELPDIVLLACALEDKRDSNFWSTILQIVGKRADSNSTSNRRRHESKPTCLDFYCFALKFLLQRVAEEADASSWKNVIVVCDPPPLGSQKFRYRSIWRGKEALNEWYSNQFTQNIGPGPSRNISQKSLFELSFHPSVYLADSSHNDLLQIADVIAGCTFSWVESITTNAQETFPITLFKKLSSKFRPQREFQHFFGNGFSLWPRDDVLWKKLQDSLK